MNSLDTNQLYGDLLKIAQTQNSAQVYAAAEELMQKLKGEVLGSQTGNNDLTYNDVSSLDNFVKHLQDKRIQYNGAYLILGAATIEKAKEDATNKLKGLYVPIYDGKLYLYKDGLIAYLEQLKGQASANATAAGKLLALALGKIEAEAQSTFNIQMPKKEVPQTQQEQAPNQEPQSQAPQATQNKQVGYQQVSEEEGQTGKREYLPPRSLPYSGDEINVLSMMRFCQFLQQLPKQYLQAPGDIGPDEAQVVYSTAGEVIQLLKSWQDQAPPPAKNGFRFPLSGSVSPDVFISTYANNTRGIAINMLSLMTRICNQLNSVLSNLRNIPAVAKMGITAEEIDEQINLGDSYITNFQHFLNMAR